MTFPLAFRPNQTATLFWPDGTNLGVQQIQIYKQLLACEWNVLAENVDRWLSPGSMICRFAVTCPLATALPVGPTQWTLLGSSYFTLSDDPRSEQWHIMDALPWLYESNRIYSGFAVKKYYAATPSSLVALPAGSATPNYSGVILQAGVNYTATLPSGYNKWFVLRTPAGCGYSYVSYSCTPAGQYPVVALARGPQEASTLVVVSLSGFGNWSGLNLHGNLCLLNIQNGNAGPLTCQFLFERFESAARGV